MARYFSRVAPKHLLLRGCDGIAGGWKKKTENSATMQFIVVLADSTFVTNMQDHEFRELPLQSLPLTPSRARPLDAEHSNGDRRKSNNVS